MGKIITLYTCALLVFIPSAGMRAQSRKIDRNKWRELRDDIRQRRYDARETVTWQDQERENRSYQDNYESNQWAQGEERMQDQNRRSDYSQQDDKYNEEDRYDTDSDIFDGNNGQGYDAGQEQGEDTYYGNEESDGWNEGHNGEGYGNDPDQRGGHETHDTYSVDPPEHESSPSPDLTVSGGISPVVMYILLGILLAFILYLLLRTVDWKNKKVNKKKIGDEDKFENLTFTKSELELAIENALKQGNYREAVRIYFLAVIKTLRDRGHISWERRKTNYAYLYEVHAKSYYNRFETATRVFEVVWYGNRTVTLSDFQSIEPSYKLLLSEVENNA